MPTEFTTIKIFADRAGSPKEIVEYLQHLEEAYNSLYIFSNFLPNSFYKSKHRFYLEWTYPLLPNMKLDNSPDLVIPENRLTITKINIQSPGFWELSGISGVLEQIREYLKDRNERRKDKEWREHAEKEKAILENRLIQSQITGNENKNLRDRIEILREFGLSESEIREFIWANVGKSLMDLGKHQDTGLINGAE